MANIPFFTVMYYAGIGMFLMLTLQTFIVPFFDKKEYEKNEISTEEYQSLHEIVRHYPPLKIWLAAQLKEKGNFTGADCDKIKYYLQQQVNHLEHEAAKLNIIQQ